MSRGHESLNISCHFITCEVGSVFSCSEEKQRKVAHYTEPIAKVVAGTSTQEVYIHSHYPTKSST